MKLSIWLSFTPGHHIFIHSYFRCLLHIATQSSIKFTVMSIYVHSLYHSGGLFQIQESMILLCSFMYPTLSIFMFGFLLYKIPFQEPCRTRQGILAYDWSRSFKLSFGPPRYFHTIRKVARLLYVVYLTEFLCLSKLSCLFLVFPFTLRFP